MAEQGINSLQQLARLLETDSKLVERIKEDPVSELRVIASNVIYPQSDRWIYRVVVCVLGTVLLVVVADAVYLNMQGDVQKYAVSEILISIGSTALGALAGLLAPSPMRTHSN
jgi:hypothetical protein